MKNDTYLFIGGTADGKSVEVGRLSGTITIPYDQVRGHTAEGAPVFATEEYRRERLSAHDGLGGRQAFDVFILKGLSTAGAVWRLIKNYRPDGDPDA